MTDKFCRGSRAYFSDALDGEKIPFFRRLMVKLHLSVCPQCIRYNQSLKETQSALQSLRDPPESK